MEATGLLIRIYDASIAIDSGRKGFATRGMEQEGRISYEDGISEAMTVFEEAQSSADLRVLILAEYTFIAQELQFCEKTDKDSISSLTKALLKQRFANLSAAQNVYLEKQKKALQL